MEQQLYSITFPAFMFQNDMNLWIKGEMQCKSGLQLVYGTVWMNFTYLIDSSSVVYLFMQHVYVSIHESIEWFLLSHV